MLDVRVCASPGRDMSADERRGKEGGTGEDDQRRRRGRKRGRKFYPIAETSILCTHSCCGRPQVTW